MIEDGQGEGLSDGTSLIVVVEEDSRFTTRELHGDPSIDQSITELIALAGAGRTPLRWAGYGWGPIGAGLPPVGGTAEAVAGVAPLETRGRAGTGTSTGAPLTRPIRHAARRAGTVTAQPSFRAGRGFTGGAFDRPLHSLSFQTPAR